MILKHSNYAVGISSASVIVRLKRAAGLAVVPPAIAFRVAPESVPKPASIAIVVLSTLIGVATATLLAVTTLPPTERNIWFEVRGLLSAAKVSPAVGAVATRLVTLTAAIPPVASILVSVGVTTAPVDALKDRGITVGTVAETCRLVASTVTGTAVSVPPAFTPTANAGATHSPVSNVAAHTPTTLLFSTSIFFISFPFSVPIRCLSSYCSRENLLLALHVKHDLSCGFTRFLVGFPVIAREGGNRRMVTGCKRLGKRNGLDMLVGGYGARLVYHFV